MPAIDGVGWVHPEPTTQVPPQPSPWPHVLPAQTTRQVTVITEAFELPPSVETVTLTAPGLIPARCAYSTRFRSGRTYHAGLPAPTGWSPFWLRWTITVPRLR